MSTFSYEVSRVVDAPAETVWAVWTEPKHHEGLFHAVPGSAALDVRPGGAWSVTMNIPGAGEEPMSGTYGDVEPHRRLVTYMTGPDGTSSGPMVMTLDPEGAGTRVTLTQECATQEERDMSEEGSTMLLEWCAEYAATVR